jgi:hypothetical protein
MKSPVLDRWTGLETRTTKFIENPNKKLKTTKPDTQRNFIANEKIKVTRTISEQENREYIYFFLWCLKLQNNSKEIKIEAEV